MRTVAESSSGARLRQFVSESQRRQLLSVRAFDFMESVLQTTTLWPNQGAAANGLSAVRSSVAGIRERAVRSTAAAEAVAELGRSAS